MSIVRGNDLMVFMFDGTNYVPLAAATNSTLSVSTESIDTSSKDTAYFGTSKMGKITWEMSTENLMEIDNTYTTEISISSVMDKTLAGTEVTLYFSLNDRTLPADSAGIEGKTAWVPEAGKTFTYTGKARITSMEVNAPNGDNATYTATFTGTGALSKVS